MGGGGVKAHFGYVLLKNGPVQEDINQTIYIIKLTPLVYKNLTSYRPRVLNDLEKVLISEID